MHINIFQVLILPIEPNPCKLYNINMRLTLLGTGTSFGVPVPTCTCHTCRSHSRKDKRLRCSAYLTHAEADGSETRILIDVTPDFRTQALRYRVQNLNAVLLTHSHADHLHGLDDLRVFSHSTNPQRVQHTQVPPVKQSIFPWKRFPPTEDTIRFPETKGSGLPVYCNQSTLRTVQERFGYIFTPVTEGGGKPKLHLEDCAVFSYTAPLRIGSIEIIPLLLMHGSMPDCGWLFKTRAANGSAHAIAYLTDCSVIPNETLHTLQAHSAILDHCVIDALRRKVHSTHLTFDEAMDYASTIAARHTWFIHMCHDLRHTEIQAYIQARRPFLPAVDAYLKTGATIKPAYDGQILIA